MDKLEKQYYKNIVKDKKKVYLTSVIHFRDCLYYFQPSMIWLDEFSEDVPYIVGSYRDKMFSGAYVKQCGLTFSLDNLNELKNIFKEGMYFYK